MFGRQSLCKSTQSSQPLSNIIGESSRKGLATLHILFHESDCSIGCDRYTGIQLNFLLPPIDTDTTEARIVAYIKINCRNYRDKKTDISIQRHLEAWKGQDVAAMGKGDARTDLERKRRSEVCLCIPCTRYFSRGLTEKERKQQCKTTWFVRVVKSCKAVPTHT
jgi:hypothetical protein